jgi:hypothetical protein
LSLLLARPLQFIFWLFWLLVDSYRKPDLTLMVPLSASEVRRKISGFSDWTKVRVFDAIDHSTGTAVAGHFEIQRGLAAYYHRLPDAVSTHNYPSSYGLAGRVIALSENSTAVPVRFRITTIRSLGYSLLILTIAFFAAVGLEAAGLPQFSGASAFARLFAISLPLTLPMGALVVTLIGDLVGQDRHKLELLNYLKAILGEYQLKPA